MSTQATRLQHQPPTIHAVTTYKLNPLKTLPANATLTTVSHVQFALLTPPSTGVGKCESINGKLWNQTQL